MMMLNPLQSYPYSQTNLLNIYFAFHGVEANAHANGVTQFKNITNLSGSGDVGITCSHVIVTAAPDSTHDIKNESGHVYNRGRCVGTSITGFKDIWNNSTNLTLSMGYNAGLYGSEGGPFNPGIMGYIYQYLFSSLYSSYLPTSTYISMSGLNNGTYDVYLYSTIDDANLSQSNASTFTLYSGSTSSSKSTNAYSVGIGSDTLGNGGQPIWVENQTYVKFSDHSTNDGKINIFWTTKPAPPGITAYGPFNGFQIIQTK